MTAHHHHVWTDKSSVSDTTSDDDRFYESMGVPDAEKENSCEFVHENRSLASLRSGQSHCCKNLGANIEEKGGGEEEAFGGSQFPSIVGRCQERGNSRSAGSDNDGSFWPRPTVAMATFLPNRSCRVLTLLTTPIVRLDTIAGVEKRKIGT